jgi:hypothetical protein
MVYLDWLIKTLKAVPAIENILLAGLLILQHHQRITKLLRINESGFVFKFVNSFRIRYSLMTAAKVVLILILFLTVAKSTGYTISQYYIWKQSPQFSQFLLPPHQSLSYFIGYTWQRFGKESAFSILFAGIAFLIFKIGNSITAGRLFYDEEPYLASIAIISVGWPNSILVIGGALICAVLTQITFLFLWFWKKRPLGLFPLIYFWLPLAILSLNFGGIIGEWLGLTQLGV